MTLWNGLLDALRGVLEYFHDIVEPMFGVHAWGWGIIMLVLAVRVLLLPLAIKQFSSMRAMQQIQPEVKKIQNKHKVDRSLLRTDPEKFRAQRTKQQEAMMALYKEHNVNPAASCLPLLAQMPIFIALFWVLRDDPALEGAQFYIIESLSAVGRVAGLSAVPLIILMAATTYLTQKQMMANNPAPAQGPQQILLYVMPIMLVFFSMQVPVGVLLYWVTTNLWTMGQQWLMFRNVNPPGTAAKTAEA